MLAEALTAVDKTGERFYEAELYRLAGAILAGAGRQERDASVRRLSEISARRRRVLHQNPKEGTMSYDLLIKNGAITVMPG